MPPLVDVAGSRDATWPDRLRGRTRLSQGLLRCDDPSRKNKNSDFCATFLRLRTPFRPLRGGNGPPRVQFAIFSGFVRVLASRGNPQSQKSCNFGRIFVFGFLDRPHASVMGGVPRAQRLCGRLWTALWAWADLAARCGGCAWRATRAAGCSGQHDAVNGVDLGQLYGWLWIDPARSAWNDPARRHKKYCHCLCARPMRQVHLLGGILAFCPPSLGFFRLPYLRALLPSFHRRTSCTAVS